MALPRRAGPPNAHDLLPDARLGSPLGRRRSTRPKDPSARGGGTVLGQNPAVESLRCQIESVGPDNRPRGPAHPDCSEVGRIDQRLEHRSPLPWINFKFSNEAIAEGQPKPIAAEGLDSAHGDHTTILGKRSDPFERFTEPGPLPVGQELLLVKPRPLEYQSLSATRELSGQDPGTVDGYGSPHTSVPSVEVRNRMVVVIPVHPDDDPVEGADPGHAANCH
jgi:hypothetical protein